MGKAAEMDMHIKQMNQLPCADRKPYNYINKCAPDRPPLGGFMLHGPYMITCRPYMIIFAQCMIIYGP